MQTFFEFISNETLSEKVKRPKRLKPLKQLTFKKKKVVRQQLTPAQQIQLTHERKMKKMYRLAGMKSKIRGMKPSLIRRPVQKKPLTVPRLPSIPSMARRGIRKATHKFGQWLLGNYK